MNRVTRERVEELRDQYQLGAGYAADCEPDDKVGVTTAGEAQSMFTDVATALTRLLALEDALKEVGPALEAVVPFLALNGKVHPGSQLSEHAFRVEIGRKLIALAALGGDT